VTVPLRSFGVPPDFHPHGSRGEVLAALGLTAADIAAQITDMLSEVEAEPVG
jgi:1-deoxy-D-xylulose-5-phosphate synthase